MVLILQTDSLTAQRNVGKFTAIRKKRKNITYTERRWVVGGAAGAQRRQGSKEPSHSRFLYCRHQTRANESNRVRQPRPLPCYLA
ncbi:hypothetical protein E2C01_079778 [Portunus trituberculatus]|uniref:Uncharacterized protein n=1 Tax=Portunus trituberculatus TaxID=210409 RepID=A0A5B7IKE7_PORTR|nr:hypothetical protein [Portunus trituberculatus]